MRPPVCSLRTVNSILPSHLAPLPRKMMTIFLWSHVVGNNFTRKILQSLLIPKQLNPLIKITTATDYHCAMCSLLSSILFSISFSLRLCLFSSPSLFLTLFFYSLSHLISVSLLNDNAWRHYLATFTRVMVYSCRLSALLRNSHLVSSELSADMTLCQQHLRPSQKTTTETRKARCPHVISNLS